MDLGRPLWGRSCRRGDTKPGFALPIPQCRIMVRRRLNAVSSDGLRSHAHLNNQGPVEWRFNYQTKSSLKNPYLP